VNGAGPLWVVCWISAAILVPTGAIAAVTRIQDRRRGRRAAIRRLSGLRLEPKTMSGPVRPEFDPAGAPPLDAEAARRRAITTLIATASRHLR
jgi:hypothetical protein